MEGADITDTGAGLMEEGITEGADGDTVLPLLVGGLGALYSVGKAYDNYRFWSDYRRNTGYSPRYLFRSGSMDWMKYGMYTGFSYGNLKRL